MKRTLNRRLKLADQPRQKAPIKQLAIKAILYLSLYPFIHFDMLFIIYTARHTFNRNNFSFHRSEFFYYFTIFSRLC